MVSRNLPKATRLLPALAMCFHVGSICVAAETSHTGRVDPAHRILADAGVRGGLIVHLGCGDGKRTAALRATESYVIHGLYKSLLPSLSRISSFIWFWYWLA